MDNWWENTKSKIDEINERRELAKRTLSDLALSPVKGGALREDVLTKYGAELSPAQKRGLSQAPIYAMPKETHNLITDVLTGSRFPQAVTWGEPQPIGLRNTLQYFLNQNVLPPKTISVSLGEETSPEKLLLHEAGHAGLRTYDPEKYEMLMNKIFSKGIAPQQEFIIGKVSPRLVKKYIRAPLRYETKIPSEKWKGKILEKYGVRDSAPIFPSTENLLRVLNSYPERQWPEEYYVEEMARKRKGY